jgi:hypothetical protein
MTYRPDLKVYIEKRIVKTPAPYDLKSPCWFWSGGQYSGSWITGGYGSIRPFLNEDGTHNERKVKIHRLMYELHNNLLCGELDGQMLLHKCDTKECCNPDHLKVGTHSENLLDYHRRYKPAKLSAN